MSYWLISTTNTSSFGLGELLQMLPTCRLLHYEELSTIQKTDRTRTRLRLHPCSHGAHLLRAYNPGGLTLSRGSLTERYLWSAIKECLRSLIGLQRYLNNISLRSIRWTRPVGLWLRRSSWSKLQFTRAVRWSSLIELSTLHSESYAGGSTFSSFSSS